MDTLADMEQLIYGIPLDEVSTSMTINSTAPILFAMYLAVAEKQGVDWKTHVTGTLHYDILKEYIAQKEYIYPPRPSMRLISDQFAFAAEEVPRWNTISISGYHITEAPEDQAIASFTLTPHLSTSPRDISWSES